MNDEKIWLETEDGQKFFIIKSERIDMQEELNKSILELKSRIEKAVEYIEYNRNKLLLSLPPREALDINVLLNILNGRSDE